MTEGRRHSRNLKVVLRGKSLAGVGPALTRATDRTLVTLASGDSMASCNQETRAGQKCRARAMANGKCAIHQHPERAKELATRSTEARRKTKAEARTKDEISAPRSPDELVRNLAQVFADLKNGKLDVAVARTMANVGMVVLKGFAVVDLKKQLTELQALLKQRA